MQISPPSFELGLGLDPGVGLAVVAPSTSTFEGGEPAEEGEGRPPSLFFISTFSSTPAASTGGPASTLRSILPRQEFWYSTDVGYNGNRFPFFFSRVIQRGGRPRQAPLTAGRAQSAPEQGPKSPGGPRTGQTRRECQNCPKTAFSRNWRPARTMRPTSVPRTAG
jgi:hypothetical protein